MFRRCRSCGICFMGRSGQDRCRGCEAKVSKKANKHPATDGAEMVECEPYNGRLMLRACVRRWSSPVTGLLDPCARCRDCQAGHDRAAAWNKP